MPKIYHLCNDYNLQTMVRKPRVPRGLASDEDEITPRVCGAPSIEDCLISLQFLPSLRTPKPTDRRYRLYVYVTEADSPYRPTMAQVPDVDETNEVWLMQDTTFKYIGAIEVLINGEYSWLEKLDKL